MLQAAQGSFPGLRHYALHHCGLASTLNNLSTKAKGKCYKASFAVEAVFFGFLVGCKSATQLAGFAEDLAEKKGAKLKGCRATIKSLLNEDRTVKELEIMLYKMIFQCRKKRVHKPSWSQGNVVVYVDGIYLQFMKEKHKDCKYCLKRVHNKGKENERVEYYHLGVSFSLSTDSGPIPIAFGLAEASSLPEDFENMTNDKQKQEGEKSVTKRVLNDMAEYFGGSLPFDILATDSLYPDAPFLELVESLGACVVSGYKQKNRTLKKEAQRCFEDQCLGLDDVAKHSWDTDPSNSGRCFHSKTVVLTDKNRLGSDKDVIINETQRTERDGKEVKNTYMVSRNLKSTNLPELLENIRFHRWSHKENGVFNQLTKNWNIFKHQFFHTSNAMLSIYRIMLLCLGVFNLYTNRNLCRRGRVFLSTVSSFFENILYSFKAMVKLTRYSFPIGKDP